MATASEWRKFPLSLAELCIETTLRCGQAFRWRKMNDEWHCALQGRIISLKQDSTHLHYRTTLPKPNTSSSSPVLPIPSLSETDSALPSPRNLTEREDKHPSPAPAMSPPPSPLLSDTTAVDTALFLHRYFTLSLSLAKLYTTWSTTDPNFARRASLFSGIRILNQDAWETLVSFICSSNNNIARISLMVGRLCESFGPLLGYVGDQAFYDFPSPEALMGGEVETRLRELGFGYRAKYVSETARAVVGGGGRAWLGALRNGHAGVEALDSAVAHKGEQNLGGAYPKSTTGCYKVAHAKLLQLPGVGPKVADCVCLMGLGWSEAVPVDTHVWQIAQRDYSFGGKSKTITMTAAMYDAVGDHFRNIWGPYAGWAQSVLFTANLKIFSENAKGVQDAKNPAPKDGTPRTRKRKTVSDTEVLAEKNVVAEQRGDRHGVGKTTWTASTGSMSRSPKPKKRSG